jgi:hypothetical protein
VLLLAAAAALSACGQSYMILTPLATDETAVALSGLAGRYEIIEDPPEPVLADIATLPGTEDGGAPRYLVDLMLDDEWERLTEDLLILPLRDGLYIGQGPMPAENAAGLRDRLRDPELESETYYYLYFFNRVNDQIWIFQPTEQGFAEHAAQAERFGVRVLTHREDSLFTTVDHFVVGPPAAVAAWLAEVPLERLTKVFVFQRVDNP